MFTFTMNPFLAGSASARPTIPVHPPIGPGPIKMVISARGTWKEFHLPIEIIRP